MIRGLSAVILALLLIMGFQFYQNSNLKKEALKEKVAGYETTAKFYRTQDVIAQSVDRFTDDDVDNILKQLFPESSYSGSPRLYADPVSPLGGPCEPSVQEIYTPN